MKQIKSVHKKIFFIIFLFLLHLEIFTIQNAEIKKLTVRQFKPCGSEINENESDIRYIINKEYQLDLQRTALVLIDVWEDHPVKDWLQRAKVNIKTKIVPLLKLARENNMTIIHAPHKNAISRLAQPIDGELNLDNTRISNEKLFDRYLKIKNIDTLIYAGYASNWCVLWRPVGMIKMKHRGYKVILLRDCTIAFESDKTLQNELTNEVVANMVQAQCGPTTTLRDLRNALN